MEAVEQEERLIKICRRARTGRRATSSADAGHSCRVFTRKSPKRGKESVEFNASADFSSFAP